MKIIDCEQGSLEWFLARLGRVTSSRIADMMAKIKTGWGAGHYNYAADLFAERVSGNVADTYKSPAMQWGTDNEPKARVAYELGRDVEVKLIGFVEHDSMMAGASPDGFVGSDGMLEMKCPNTATHLDILENETFEGRYILQVQWQMFICERKWCDLISFDPRLRPSMRLFIKRVHRDQTIIDNLHREALIFLDEIDRRIERLDRKYPTDRLAA